MNRFLFIISLLCCVISCKKSDYPIAKKTPADLDSIVVKYYEQYLKINPLEATAQGDYRYNDLLSIDIDKDFVAGEIAFYNETLSQLKSLNYDQLSEQQKLVYDVLNHTLEDRVTHHSFGTQYIPFTPFEGLPLEFPLLGSGADIQPFKTEKDYSDWMKRMEKFPEWMEVATENFREGIINKMVLPEVLVQKMIGQMRASELTTTDLEHNIFYTPIENLPSQFSPRQKEEFTKQYSEIILKKIIPAYTRMGVFLEKEYLPNARKTDGYNALPKGKDLYNFYVKSRATTSLTPKEIHQRGLQEVVAIRREMEAVKQSLGFEGSLEQFLIYLKTDEKAMAYNNDEELLETFNGIYKKIQPKLGKIISEKPRIALKTCSSEAYIYAFQKMPYKKRFTEYCIPKNSVASGLEVQFLREALPGYHYQITSQQNSETLPKLMRFGWSNAYTKGWAHYSETLGAELGLYADPHQKMGYLKSQMLGAMRLVIDTGLHLGIMNQETATKYYLNNLPYEEDATAEVQRCMALPARALGDRIGALKIREMRERYAKSLGKKFNLADFHNELLNTGSLPLHILERKMEHWAKQR